MAATTDSSLKLAEEAALHLNTAVHDQAIQHWEKKHSLSFTARRKKKGIGIDEAEE